MNLNDIGAFIDRFGLNAFLLVVTAFGIIMLLRANLKTQETTRRQLDDTRKELEDTRKELRSLYAHVAQLEKKFTDCIEEKAILKGEKSLTDYKYLDDTQDFDQQSKAQEELIREQSETILILQNRIEQLKALIPSDRLRDAPKESEKEHSKESE